jgi:hypothetical protein
MDLQLKVLDGDYSIHRLDPDSDIPAPVFAGEFSFVAHTDDELSVVCLSGIPINSSKVQPGWSCLKVVGPLDFDLTGILSGISSALAQAQISIFAVSTYDTDYVLVRSKDLDKTRDTLIRAGYRFE